MNFDHPNQRRPGIDETVKRIQASHPNMSKQEVLAKAKVAWHKERTYLAPQQKPKD